MEKLTLEHIAPYLPYKMIGKSLGGRMYYLDTFYNMRGEGIENREIGTFINEQFKPILRPMDLTKLITIDGKYIIPAMVLAKIVGDIHNDDLDDNWSFKDTGYVDIKTPWDLRIQMFYKTPTLMFSVYDTWNYKEKRTHNQLLAFQWLFKHKFDVFGIIEKGLAIDVNTLQTNPYE